MKNTEKIRRGMLVVLLLLLLAACRDQQKKEEPVGEPEVNGKEAVEAPAQIVSVAQAKAMYTQYSEKRVPLIERSEQPRPDGSKFEAARYTYYDYETIKQYLAYIEQEAKLAGVEISSLRFYFSTYPDQTTFEDGKEVKHPRQNSVFLIPAIQHEGEEYGFITEEDGTGDKKRAVLLNGQLEFVPYKGMAGFYQPADRAYAGLLGASLLPFQTQYSTILNEGNSAPPPHK